MILVVGLSPVWQRTLHFAQLIPGRVNRAGSVTETASGKGVNVVRVLGQLGAQARLLTVAGGHRGGLLVGSLRAKKIAASIVPVAAETRICQTLLAADQATELVEEAGPVRRVELARILAEFSRQLRRARVLALSGSVPSGCGEDFYARLARLAAARDLPVLIDAQRQQLWNALPARPWVVKVNRDELLAATGQTDVRRAISLVQERGAQWVVISNGAGPVLSVSPGGRCDRLEPPRIAALNPIGSGDAMLAGIAAAVARGWEMPRAVRYGMACGTANAMTAEPGHVRRADLDRLWRPLPR